MKRPRKEQWKLSRRRRCWSRLPYQCLVHNLFRPSTPAQGLTGVNPAIYNASHSPTLYFGWALPGRSVIKPSQLRRTKFTQTSHPYHELSSSHPKNQVGALIIPYQSWHTRYPLAVSYFLAARTYFPFICEGHAWPSIQICGGIHQHPHPHV